MNKIIYAASTFLLILSCVFSGTSMAGTPVNISLAPMLQKALPSVVNIRAQIKITDINALSKLERSQGGPVPDKFLSVGSGVIVNADKGYILTNAHVVDDAERVVVTLSDGRHYTAKTLGADKASDIALLQVQAKNLTAMTLGNSNDLKVGDFVAAIGNPFGLSQSVSSGIVSALGRSTLGIENYENFIQIDAPINPGNSGGALVDTQGRLVGINTAILAPDRGSIGIGFAIPSNMAQSVMQQLIEYGNVRRGALGIGAQDISPELATAFNVASSKGALVTQIIPNSPAEKAGLQVGDVITAVNGENIKTANDVVNAVGFIRVDSKANISILRKNKPSEISAVLMDPKKRAQADEMMDPFLYGVSLKDFTLLSPIHGDVKGVLVVSVQDDSNAWHSDLRPGDVITSANQQKITSIAELKKIAADAKDNLLLNILRGPGAVFLVISKES
ncbi:MAG TPA: Do family serine endopeptidase [Gammaproteobacteria bacterium]|nr:Do family serine endopeptidase [Gammaproteobacteria bacterium]